MKARATADERLADARAELGEAEKEQRGRAPRVEKLRAKTLQLQSEIDELRSRIAALEAEVEEVDDELGEAEAVQAEAQEAVDEARRGGRGAAREKL